MFLINGLEQDTLPASDRATQFGDGCFTTARIRHGDVCLLADISDDCRVPVKNY